MKREEVASHGDGQDEQDEAQGDVQGLSAVDELRFRGGKPVGLSVSGDAFAAVGAASTRAVGTHPAVQASAIADYHINHSVLGGNQAIPQHEQARRLRTDPPNQKDVRNAIERVTVGATRIEILLNESVVAEGLDRVLTLPWTRTSSRRRREIIQRVGAKRSNPYEQCERRRETVSSKHCATLTAGSTNSWSIPPRPSSRSPSARAKASARSE